MKDSSITWGHVQTKVLFVKFCRISQANLCSLPIVGDHVEDFVLVFFVVLVSLTVEKCRYNVTNEGLLFVDVNYKGLRVDGPRAAFHNLTNSQKTQLTQKLCTNDRGKKMS